MSITTILFDLDGTLLPMDQDTFAKAYIKGLTAVADNAGYNPKTFSKIIYNGIVAMINNDGRKTNEDVFWDVLAATYGESIRNHIRLFDKYYATDFQKIKDICGFAPQASELIKYVKEKGYRVALATNPLFPKVATESRIRWAGLQPKYFEIYTTYENSFHCKPNTAYYTDVMEQLGVNPEECLMVGNDVSEDMIAESLGMKVFLLTDCMINKNNSDISVYANGSFDELMKYINKLK